jgi:hypothetical protein
MAHAVGRPVIHFLIAPCNPKTGYPLMAEQRLVLPEEAELLRTKGYVTIADPADQAEAQRWDMAHNQPKPPKSLGP